MDYRQLCIDEKTSLRDAMSQLDKTARQILFVVQGDVLVGTLTDGDVRRYMLRGGTLEDTVEKACFLKPKAVSNRKQAEELFKEGAAYPAVPVVDEAGVMLDVVFREKKKADTTPKLNIPVVIMAGGKGTRLYPYTKILPKPLIPVGDLPIIEHIMNRFLEYACDDFHVIVNHKKQLIKAYFRENEESYRLSWYDEDKPLGTGGGLSLLKGHIHSTFFLTNCDILLLADYEDMLRFHRKQGNAVTMICAHKHITIPYGVINAGTNGEILAMREKPKMDFLTNTGMYIVEADVLDDIAQDVAIGFPDIMEMQKAKGRKIGAYAVEEEVWLDMGQMEELEAMRKRLYDK